MAIQAFIFDLDGVITDTAEYHFKAWKRLADSLDIPFDRTANEELKGVDRTTSLELILARGSKQYSAEEKKQFAHDKNEYYKTLIDTMSSDDLLPGSVTVLQAVKDRGLKVAMASASKNAFTVLNRLGITKMFDFVVDAGTIKNGKPDPEIFLAAAEGVGIAPASCIGVEDAAAGVSAIKSAGMYAIAVGDAEVLAEADRVLDDLTQLNIEEYLV